MDTMLTNENHHALGRTKKRAETKYNYNNGKINPSIDRNRKIGEIIDKLRNEMIGTGLLC